jgi:hypothetical protein
MILGSFDATDLAFVSWPSWFNIFRFKAGRFNSDFGNEVLCSSSACSANKQEGLVPALIDASPYFPGSNEAAVLACIVGRRYLSGSRHFSQAG